MDSEFYLDLIKGLVAGNFSNLANSLIAVGLGVFALVLIFVLISFSYKNFTGGRIVAIFILLGIGGLACYSNLASQKEGRDFADTLTLKEVIGEYPLQVGSSTEIDFTSLEFTDEENVSRTASVLPTTKLLNDAEVPFVKVQILSFELSPEQEEKIATNEILKNLFVERVSVLEVHY